MKLNQPFRRSAQYNEERISFNTPEPVEAEVSQPEVPPLVSTKTAPVLPKLEKTPKKTVELSPPQPVAEVKATAEPEQSGGVPQLKPSKSMAEWPFSTKEKEEALVQIKEELKPAVEAPPAIPKLVLTKGTGETQKVEVPKLDAYNKMEVVHLLIGRSPEDEEIVLLQSFAERFVRTKNQEEFHKTLFQRATTHYSKMVGDGKFDFVERQGLHNFEAIYLTPQLAAKGVEWVAALTDNGNPAAADVQSYADSEGLDFEEALEEVKENRIYYKDPAYVYTWALVKVKIGHDFGDYKLSELMPNL